MAPRNNALARPLCPSRELAALVGPGRISRAQAVKTVWSYIKANDLQDPRDRREILADARLEALVGSRRVSMLHLSRFIAANLGEAGAAANLGEAGARSERPHSAGEATRVSSGIAPFRVLLRVKAWLPSRASVPAV
jgi:hypothetical protein